MAQGVRAGWFGNASLQPRLFYGALQDRLVKDERTRAVILRILKG